MEDGPNLENFGSSENLLAYIKERSVDIEKAIIPQLPELQITRQGVPVCHIPVGMILNMIDGHRKMLTPEDAEFLLNDGLLSRMRIKIELYRGGTLGDRST